MFNATDELAALRRRRRVSKLAACRAELVALRHAGASYSELALWLRLRKRCQVHRDTVRRYLLQQSEMNT